jgi:predicted acetyltransferase
VAIEIRVAKEENQNYIRELLNEYLVELSAFGDVDHSYPYFDAYWTECRCRWPYLILGDGEVVGFAFVNTISPSGRGVDFAMAEFYIQPSARERGYGLAAVNELFLKHPGVWELSIMRANERAQRFWTKAISLTERYEAENSDHKEEIIHRFSV